MVENVITKSGAIYTVVHPDDSCVSVVIRQHKNCLIIWNDVIPATAFDIQGREVFLVINAENGEIQMCSTEIVTVERDVELPDMPVF